MSPTKIGESTTNITKLLFFTINLHFVTSNQIYPFRKLNLPLSSSISFVFLPLEMQKKTQTDESMPRVFLLCLKRNDPQTFKSASCKSFSFYVITKRQFSVTLRLFKRHFATFFEASVLKEIRILCIISTLTTWC